MVIVAGRPVSLALATVTFVVAALLIANLAVFQPQLHRAIAGTSAIRLAHEAMLDQQVGLRGFLLSGDDGFFEAYERGHDALPSHAAEAATLLAGEGRVGQLLLDTRLAQEAWIREWAGAAFALGERAPSGTAVPDEFLAQDKALFDRYRQTYDLLISELVDLREGAIHDLRLANTLALTVAIATSSVGIVLTRRRLGLLRRDVDQPLAMIFSRLEAIERGDLTPGLPPGGPLEMQQLGSGLERTAIALARSQEEAEQHRRVVVERTQRQAEVLAFAREVSGNLSMKYVLRGVCAHAQAVAGGSRVVVWLMDESHEQLTAFADTAGADLHAIGRDPIAVGEGLVGQAGRFGHVTGREITGTDADGLAVPMVAGAEVIGVLEFSGAAAAHLSEDGLEMIETLAVHAATALGAARLHEHTAGLAMTDALTTLPNRRHLDADLQVECKASARYDRLLALLMIDIDLFKPYNDSFGHPAGDVALQEVAQVLADEARATDTLYRYGGEEFTAILRETTTDDAITLAERMRGAVEHRFATPDAPRPITISIGVSGFRDHGPSAATLLAAADVALYDAKTRGRNQVATAAVGQ